MIKIKSKKTDIVRYGRIVKLVCTISLASIFLIRTLIQTLSCSEVSLPDILKHARLGLNPTVLKSVSVNNSNNFNLIKEKILKRVHYFKHFRRIRTFSRFLGSNLQKYFSYLESQSSICSRSYLGIPYASPIFLKTLSIRF